MIRNRIDYIDITKGILILLVLVQHYSSAIRSLGISTDFDNGYTAWHPAFLMFIMPCFFFVSGYCSNFDIDCRSFYKKTLKCLVIPYVMFQLINCFLYMIAVEQELSFKAFFSLVSHTPYTNLWFLIALFVSKVLVYNLKKLFSLIIVVFLTFILLVIAICLYRYKLLDNVLCFKNSLASCFFVAIGCYLKNEPIQFQKAIYLGPFVYIPVLLILFVFHLPKPSLTAFIDVNLRTLPLFVLMSLSGTFAMLRLSQAIGNCAFFSFFGRNSLVVYGLHFIPLFCLVRFFFHLISPVTLLYFLCMIIVVYSLELLVCYLSAKLLNNKSVKWIIGK